MLLREVLDFVVVEDLFVLEDEDLTDSLLGDLLLLEDVLELDEIVGGLEAEAELAGDNQELEIGDGLARGEGAQEGLQAEKGLIIGHNKYILD